MCDDLSGLTTLVQNCDIIEYTRLQDWDAVIETSIEKLLPISGWSYKLDFYKAKVLIYV